MTQKNIRIIVSIVIVLLLVGNILAWGKLAKKERAHTCHIQHTMAVNDNADGECCMLSENLNLTPRQQSQFDSICALYCGPGKALNEQLRQYRNALVSMALTATPDCTTMAQIKDSAAMTYGKLLDVVIDQYASLASILTPDQQHKLSDNMIGALKCKCCTADTNHTHAVTL